MSDPDIARPAAFLSRSSLARELDCAESTVDELVRRGVIPPPVRPLSHCVRWKWTDVEAALDLLKAGAGKAAPDPYMAGADNVTQIREKRRGPA